MLISCFDFFPTLMMETVCSHEASVDFHRIRRRYVPEDRTFHSHFYENLRCYYKCLKDKRIYIFWTTLQPLWALAAFQFPGLFTIDRTHWTSDQLVARPLPTHRTVRKQNKHIYTSNIHALNGIRTHDHSVRASEDSSCLRPVGYRDRQTTHFTPTSNK
jgi:hypothetical protein